MRWRDGGPLEARDGDALLRVMTQGDVFGELAFLLGVSRARRTCMRPPTRASSRSPRARSTNSPRATRPTRPIHACQQRDTAQDGPDSIRLRKLVQPAVVLAIGVIGEIREAVSIVVDGIAALGVFRVPDHSTRNAAQRNRAIAELAVEVPSPAPHHTPRCDSAGMPAPCGERRHPTREARYRNQRGLSHRRAIAELSEVVGAPTQNTSIAENHTVVLASGGDGCDTGQESRHRGRLTSRPADVAVTELTFTVISPALNASGQRESAVVAISRCDRRDSAQACHEYGIPGLRGVLEPN